MVRPRSAAGSASRLRPLAGQRWPAGRPRQHNGSQAASLACRLERRALRGGRAAAHHSSSRRLLTRSRPPAAAHAPDRSTCRPAAKDSTRSTRALNQRTVIINRTVQRHAMQQARTHPRNRRRTERSHLDHVDLPPQPLLLPLLRLELAPLGRLLPSLGRRRRRRLQGLRVLVGRRGGGGRRSGGEGGGQRGVGLRRGEVGA